MHDFEPYWGAKKAGKELGQTVNVVLRLIADLVGKGYHIFTDNWYTS